MSNYERIYVVSVWYAGPVCGLDGQCCEVAYRTLESAKRKYNQLKKELMEQHESKGKFVYTQSEDGEFIMFSAPASSIGMADYCILKIEYLDLTD